ncbi:hypothetical protein PCANC_18552 [Puccinia coronata f. sp. avenae]|uniref:Elongin-C n=1 Tax=Puccinia coronata f. sp. avenae TaxID=200324 RepID=A0A2N5ST97_9BASI|nr:hypothetical protein PCANC_18552 [Puccinia coronata f. sp. avenae]PLW24043.1 hypothetical protein PCASD_14500 [Puccinia coronata f. sp. avenae]PLW50368.1 hypothetical protein PCASD_01655 [Puccinia coronata f. sp. avenae]
MAQGASGSKYVTLVSEEGFRFIIPKPAAVLSNTLKDMLSEDMGMLEAESGVVNLMHSAPVVEKLCHYLLFRHHHITTRDDQSTSKGSAHNFDDQIPIELALQLLECADFLDI